ncbi:MAG: type II toxin-antitoxin system PemK/MazF family toxin [Vulcanimicrobiota bacterium]
MELRRGSVILVDLEPTRGSETGKTRPAVVVTNDHYNRRVPVIQVVPLTEWSPKKANIKTNVVVEPTSENGLSKRSVADCLQTRPIDRRHRVVGLCGVMDTTTMELLDEALRILFAL